jgi:hypothetical protein
MSILLPDSDLAKVQSAASQVIKDSIGELANVLIPAIAAAGMNVASSLKITVGPITIAPIEIVLEAKDK